MKSENLTKVVSTYSFLMLFPGFFFYNFFVARGYIPPLLGGYFGIVATLIFLVIITASCWDRYKKPDLIIKVFYFQMLLELTLILINYLLLNPIHHYEKMFVWSISSIFFNLVCYLIAKNLNFSFLAKTGSYLLLFMFTMIIMNVGEHGIFYLKEEAGSVSDSVSTYQGFARSIVVVLLLSSAYYFKKGYKFYIIIALGVVSLFFNGARSEFALFCISITTLYMVYSITSLKTLLSLLLLILLGVLLIITTLDLLPDSRMLQLFQLEQSSSGQSRMNQIYFAVGRVMDRPIFGDYGSYTSLGGIGHFPHNFISVWVNFGILGMLSYVFLFSLLWLKALKGSLRKNKSSYFALYFIFLVFVTFCVLASKPHNYMLLGLLAGIYTQYQRSLRDRNG